MRLVEICIGKAGLSGFSFSETNNLRFLVHDNQKVKIKCTQNRDIKDFKIKEEEYPGAWLGVHDLLINEDEYSLMPALNEYSFNPIIYFDDTPFERKGMYFVTIDCDSFTQLRYYTDCEIIRTFNNKKTNQIGCIFLASSKNVSNHYFTIYGKNKDGKFASYVYDFISETLKYSEKFRKDKLSRLKSIYRKHKNPLGYKYSGNTVPKYILCKESQVDQMLSLYRELTDSDDLDLLGTVNVITIPDNLDCEKIENDDLISSLISDKISRTKALLLSNDISLPYEICKKEKILYLFKVGKKNNHLILQQVKYR